MTINNLKCIDNLTIELPVEKGLYAITGENGSGKSTIVTCASSAFFQMIMTDYFGRTESDAGIEFELNGLKCVYKKVFNKDHKLVWRRRSDKGFKIKGFYEGSLIFGNRFRNATVETLRKVGNKEIRSLTPADDFIRKNLGLILQGDENYYKNLSFYEDDHLKAPVFFYERSGKSISQFHMSTGENLLISILYSLHARVQDRDDISLPCIILLDEIELALHPASLRRLVGFLEKIASQYNYAIYFSTHSLEIIGSIRPENIFFVKHFVDNTYEIVNPCYPAYATKVLYDHDGFDKVFLVEDDLAKIIIKEILWKEKLMGNKLVHVLPCGGFSNVIDLAYDVVKFNLLTKKASVAMILDRDIEDKAKSYVRNKGENFNVSMNFLPVESLEKYLKTSLVVKVDHTLHSTLNDYLFHKRSLDEVIKEYVVSGKNKTDNAGKKLFDMLENELNICGHSRADVVKIVMEHIFEVESEKVKELTEFLKSQK